MAFDSHSNFGYSTIAAAPAPANSGTSLQVAAGQGALFPSAPFNCTVWPSGVNPLASNAEIVRVTAVVGDTFTIVRAQEGTSAINIAVGYQIANTTSVKVFTDIESAPVISAGTTAATGPFTFADANGVTFGMDNGTVTASVNPGGGGAAISAGANSQSTGTVVFANSNGITFGLDGAGNLTASHDGLTSQSNQAFSASGGSSAFQTLIFAASNGITFINSNGSVVASYTVPSTAGLISNINVSAGTTSNNLTAITFANSNGVTFGLNNGTITASIPAGAAAGSISAGTQSFALGQAIFANSNGVTFGMDNGTITASHNGLTSQSNQAASASNGSFEFQTLNFSNANNVTFGTSAGGIITASVNAAGAAGATVMEFLPQGVNFFLMGAIVDSAASVQSFEVNNNVSFTQCAFAVNQSVTLANNNSTGGINFSGTMVLLTGSGGTLNSISSTTFTAGATMSSLATTNNTGAFFVGFDFTGLMTPGSYWAAIRIATTNTGGIITGAATTALSFNHSLFGVNSAVMAQHIIRSLGNGTNLSEGYFSMVGLHATSNMTQIQAANMSMNNSGHRACLAIRFKA